jgi:hypothetical protein
MADVERFAYGFVPPGGPQARLDEIVHVHQVHQATAVSGNDDWTAIPHPVPEECLPVERIVRPVDERRTQGHHREPLPAMHT